MRTRAFALTLLVIVAVAVFARIPGLADRPMHADEAVFAYKLGTLLETGTWAYQPGDYHGPLLHWLTAVAVRSSGVRNQSDLTEPILRIVPALLGIAFVLTPLLLSGAVGQHEALASAALAAISPAMVYYSRFYIPEMLLVYLTACLIAALYRYSLRPKHSWALVAGLLAGLMFVTKETAVIALVSLAVAALFAGNRKGVNWRHMLTGAVATAAVVALVLGPRETLDAMGSYVHKAFQDDRHAHPAYYYLELLLWSRAAGGPIWSEALLVVLATTGAVSSLGAYGGSRRFVRFLAAYTIAMTAAYSFIPYKTPWCLLGFLHGMILLAGVGLVWLTRIGPGWIRRVIPVVVGLGAIHLGAQAYLASRGYAADPRNPYSYAHTTRDIYEIRHRLEELATAHPEGRNLPIQVISGENVWPLPWYLRSFPKVEWRRAVTPAMQPAPVILATPDLEPALLHHLYEVQPPGRRPLYVDLFSGYTELRPGLQLRGYVQQSIAVAR